MPEFDDLSESFVRNSVGKDRQKIIREVERSIVKMEKGKTDADAEDLASAKMYLKVMQLMSSSPSVDIADYVASETSRMSSLMSSDDVSAEKKKQFQKRANILKSFS